MKVFFNLLITILVVIISSQSYAIGGVISKGLKFFDNYQTLKLIPHSSKLKTQICNEESEQNICNNNRKKKLLNNIKTITPVERIENFSRGDMYLCKPNQYINETSNFNLIISKKTNQVIIDNTIIQKFLEFNDNIISWEILEEGNLYSIGEIRISNNEMDIIYDQMNYLTKESKEAEIIYRSICRKNITK